jgi:outer membrane protein TolC
MSRLGRIGQSGGATPAVRVRVLTPDWRFPRIRRACGVLALVTVLTSAAGCATYKPRPLPAAPDVKAHPDALRSDVARFRLVPLRPIRIEPADGLDPLEVAVLAVLNSPDLAAKRAALGVSTAQVFAAGLLPDPQFSASSATPIAGPDTQQGFSVSPSLDLAGLLQRAQARRAARSTARQADLDLLWAEWGVAQQARALAETALADEARVANLQAVLAAAGARSDRSSAALARHDVTAQTAAADLAVKLDAQTLLATALHDAQKARRDLNALLDLQADVRLPLVAAAEPQTYSADAIEQALQALPGRRPDLLALQAGYAGQDANLRKAILAQFPLTQIALAFARDTAGVTSIGPAAAFALPIFNGGRGQVRIQEATREQLRAEYQARLDQAQAEVASAQGELTGALALRQSLRADVPRLEALAAPAQAALARRDIDSQTYLTLTQSMLSRRADLADRELAARLAEIQLETALFLPPATSRSSP